MANVFQIGEIVNIGVEDEVTGIALYAALAEKTKTEPLKAFFLKMAEKERVHEERFRTLLTQVGDPTLHETFPGEYEAYLRALLDARAFPSPQAALSRAKAAADSRAAIKLALQMEKDTLGLFLEVVKLLPDRHRPVVQAIIDEERSHVVELSGQLRKLGVGGRGAGAGE